MCHVAVNCLVYPQRLFIVHVAYYTTQVIQAAMSDLEKIMDAIKKTQGKLDDKLAEFKSESKHN